MEKVSSQICAAHIELIEQVAGAIGERHPAEQAQLLIARYREDGWIELARALQGWLEGETPDDGSLDHEDSQIVAGISRAAENPQWLADLAERARAEAAQGIANLIYAGTWGDHDALEVLAHMREAARESGIRQSAADAFIAIVEGERDLERLLADHPQADPALIKAVFEQFQVLEAE